MSPDRETIGHTFEVKSIRVEPTHAIHGNQDFTVLNGLGYVPGDYFLGMLHVGDGARDTQDATDEKGYSNLGNGGTSPT